MRDAAACSTRASSTSAWAITARDGGWLEESLALARELGAEAQANVALHPLCIAALGEGELAMARRYADEALAIARRHDDQGRLAAALNAVAQLHRVAGELDLAEPLYAQFARDRAGARRSRERRHRPAATRRSSPSPATMRRGARLLASVLAIVDETGSRQVAQCLLEVAAGVAALAADWPRVGVFYGAAQAQMRQTGIQRDPADEAALAPHVDDARRALGAEAFAEAVRDRRAAGARNRDGRRARLSRRPGLTGLRAPRSRDSRRTGRA